MSERRPKRLWRCYVRDMIGFCGHILQDTVGVVGRESATSRIAK